MSVETYCCYCCDWTLVLLHFAAQAVIVCALFFIEQVPLWACVCVSMCFTKTGRKFPQNLLHKYDRRGTRPETESLWFVPCSVSACVCIHGRGRACMFIYLAWVWCRRAGLVLMVLICGDRSLPCFQRCPPRGVLLGPSLLHVSALPAAFLISVGPQRLIIDLLDIVWWPPTIGASGDVLCTACVVWVSASIICEYVDLI